MTIIYLFQELLAHPIWSYAVYGSIGGCFLAMLWVFRGKKHDLDDLATNLRREGIPVYRDEKGGNAQVNTINEGERGKVEKYLRTSGRPLLVDHHLPKANKRNKGNKK